VEDYYQTTPFKGTVGQGNWYRYQSRLEPAIHKTLDLLDQFGARATFFALGWVADAAPELLRLIASRGHEIATRGYYHRAFEEFTPHEFKYDVIRARDTLEQVIGQRVLGFRIAEGRLRPQDLWALKVLQDLGFAYDSSLKPLFREWSRDHIRRFVQRTKMPGPEFWEVPFSSTRLLGMDLPIAGGNYFRQLPPWMMRQAVLRWMQQCRAPFVMYFHTWEMDPAQPRIAGTPLLGRIRQYRNLERMPVVLAHYLSTYKFTSIAEYLRLEQTRAAEAEPFPTIAREAAAVTGAPREAVTIIVPCFNAEFLLPRLVNTIQNVRAALADRYEVRAILVDDASTDGTWEVMSRMFAWDEGARCYHQPHYLGTAATILRGIRDAETDIVCSIDAECSYDPHQLAELLPLLTKGVDVVTASPYHPAGRIKNVPWWRQAFPRLGELLYRVAFRHQLHTYSSVFRVYRRSAVVEMQIREDGLVGVTEMLGELEHAGARIVECPVALESREAGLSTWKLFRAGMGHLWLMARLMGRRVFGRRRPGGEKGDGRRGW
jgi:polysaccharide deacetylase family protein (PEP-CTERM system associated)